jgi:hypothetical protein
MKNLLFLLVFLTAIPSADAMECGKIQSVSAHLHSKWQEIPVAQGTTKTRLGTVGIMQVFASKSGTWTFLAISADGIACVIAAGHHFDLVPPPEIKQPGM